MTWRELLGQRRVVNESTDRQEIETLLQMAQRSLSDAHTRGLSDDGRFGLAYDAVRVLASVVVRASGYRVKLEGGGHYNTFQALHAAGPEFEEMVLYFDACRKKRNDFQYERANIVSKLETEELLLRATTFSQTVGAWLKKNHREFAP
jgi:hypothetical protein